ncbi:Acid_phosphatase surE [Hexamita inflata]|uniref:Acid phosphatase surE n=1 Tax=Hexamita inflata TaxID=28002 RepID=A0AA86PR94_9EUKA|nr:Acid phosphatase surE [Hexamita inflata]
MKILITNDDGYSAPGLVALAKILHQQHEIFVIAPSSNQSGISQAMSAQHKLQFIKQIQYEYACFSVTGTPSDCVRLGIPILKQKFNFQPQLVISGINNGANQGRDLHYSGTFGGAREAIIQGYPAISMSFKHYNLTVEQLMEHCSKYLSLIVNKALEITSLSHVVNVNFTTNMIGIKVCEMEKEIIWQLSSQIETNVAQHVIQRHGFQSYKQGLDFELLVNGYATVSYVSASLKCEC